MDRTAAVAILALVIILLIVVLVLAPYNSTLQQCRSALATIQEAGSRALSRLDQEDIPDRSNVLILIGSGNDYTDEINRSYCQSQGYAFLVQEIGSVYRGVSLALTNYSYVLWLNTSAAIIDYDHTLDSLIRLSDGSDIVVSRDPLAQSALDSSILLIKSSDYTRALFLQASEKGDLQLSEEQELPNPFQQLHNGSLNNVLETGYPVVTEHLCIVHEDVFNGERSPFLHRLLLSSDEHKAEFYSRMCDTLRLHGRLSPTFLPYLSPRPIFPWDSSHQLVVPTHIPASVKGSHRKIPKVLYQTFETRVLPSFLYRTVQSWVGINPEYEYRYSTGKKCRQYIVSAVREGRLDSSVLRAYDSLYPGAYKADLWRYCCLYLEGGVYADIKAQALTKLDNIIGEEDEVVIVLDRMGEPKATLYNAFFACTPLHPLIKKTIELTVENIENRRYGEDTLDITGPLTFGKAVYRALGHPDKGYVLPTGLSQHTPYGNIRVLVHTEGRKICDERGVPIIHTRSPNHQYNEENNWYRLVGEDPQQLWQDRQVYMDPYPHCLSESQFYHSITGKPHYSNLWYGGKVYGTQGERSGSVSPIYTPST
jgi:hypothetical protein